MSSSLEKPGDAQGLVRVVLGGDVMTGRGIDQVLAHPSGPELHEEMVRDARTYVGLAQRAHGAINGGVRPVDAGYIWGDALGDAAWQGADVRIVNLETSITESERFWVGKGIHYRMHPANIDCLTVAGIDCCSLANNHAMDWGDAGLCETLRVLDAAGMRHAGAGRDGAEAGTPAAIEVRGKGSVLVFSCGTRDCGIPREWRARVDRPGVCMFEDYGEGLRTLAEAVGRRKGADDVAIVSIHWGGNWGFDVPEEQMRLAHGLVDAGADIVHGHSSHHAKAAEFYRGKLILYGCGDLVTDYEGIGGKEGFRGDVAGMYAVEFDRGRRCVREMQVIPMRMHRFQLRYGGVEDARWLAEVLQEGGARAQVGEEGARAVVKCWGAEVGSGRA